MPLIKTISSRVRETIVSIANDCSGLALIEFAFTTPFLMVLALGGVEVANYSIANMRISQIAVSLADNASRAKQEVVSGVPRMREVDVNEAFGAAQLQSGALDVVQNGRLIVSSLEVNSDGGQWIHWQRCFGSGNFSSSYGVEGDGESGTDLAGLGPSGRQVTAEAGSAIMFVEVIYDYKALVFDNLLGEGPIRKVAAMFVRDDRELAQIYNPAPTAVVNTCS